MFQLLPHNLSNEKNIPREFWHYTITLMIVFQPCNTQDVFALIQLFSFSINLQTHFIFFEKLLESKLCSFYWRRNHLHSYFTILGRLPKKPPPTLVGETYVNSIRKKITFSIAKKKSVSCFVWDKKEERKEDKKFTPISTVPPLTLDLVFPFVGKSLRIIYNRITPWFGGGIHQTGKSDG